jgi:ATP-binding cassette subfamily F protein uup
MMDRVSTDVFGLDGFGNAERFADYSQWETWQRSQTAKSVRVAAPPSAGPTSGPSRATVAKRKLSYIEAREYATLEARIAQAEQSLEAKRAALDDPAIASDGPRLLAASVEIEAAQNIVDQLYARWAELEDL